MTYVRTRALWMSWGFNFAWKATRALIFGLAVSGMAAEFKGFVEDTACSSKAGMKDNAACAEKCIKGGSPAVLVGEDGKIYKIAALKSPARSIAR